MNHARAVFFLNYNTKSIFARHMCDSTWEKGPRL